ncbi:MAG: hypothetical protein HZT40_00015 [Candidatus Thiothrix singaporensis]|uniref:Uncharacterized protein n=1 Tax=Candidatus Thiothrix singaporensis TaxID=2799669 RepID=A0A7L6AM98_9GAMM|nr:MAG: hypothetical protein HZT40_00015 [Candidatus Thiothrix singaporensis]
MITGRMLTGAGAPQQLPPLAEVPQQLVSADASTDLSAVGVSRSNTPGRRQRRKPGASAATGLP